MQSFSNLGKMDDFSEIFYDYVIKYGPEFRLIEQKDIIQKFNKYRDSDTAKMDAAKMSRMLPKTKKKKKSTSVLKEETFIKLLVNVFDRSRPQAESEVARIQILRYYPKLNEHDRKVILSALGASLDEVHTVGVYEDLENGLRRRGPGKEEVLLDNRFVEYKNDSFVYRPKGSNREYLIAREKFIPQKKQIYWNSEQYIIGRTSESKTGDKFLYPDDGSIAHSITREWSRRWFFVGSVLMSSEY